MAIEARTYTGEACVFFETGCEGLMWSVALDGFSGYEGLFLIAEGDLLTLSDAEGNVPFSGTIEPDRKAGWTAYPANPDNGQPQALGYWVHWTQRGWDPDRWAALFLHEPPLRARVSRIVGEVPLDLASLLSEG